jgi:outer membrane protein
VNRSEYTFRRVAAIGFCATFLVSPTFAQRNSIEPVRPTDLILRRPYTAPVVPPINSVNTDRLRGLIRAGNLYLTVQDAIALALENNIDLEIARYNPITLAWNLERAQAGGALPGVTSGASQAVSVASGQGVLGSQAAAGVSVSSNSATRGTSNTTVAQVGPVTANLDPAIQQATTFSHRSAPQPDPVQSISASTIVTNLIQGQRIYTGSYQQGFLTGGGFTVSYNNHYLNENAPTDFLNPSVAPSVSISMQHNLLQGRGIAVNARTITVAKMNLDMSDLNFRTEVTNIAVNVLGSYYSLVAAYDDVKAKQSALETAQRFYEESRKRLELGALAQLDITTAQNQIAASQLALTNSVAALQQQQLQLKSLISRTGTGDPVIAEVQIMPLDRLAIPASDDIPPIRDLAQKALNNRSDLQAEKESIKTSEVSALGTINGILPSAQVFTTISSAGLAGKPQVVTTRAGTFVGDAYFKGGIGNALGQVFRRNFPSENIGVFGRAAVHDRQAQGDYGIDQLQLRQQQLTTAKDLNQAQVDVTNSVVALRQARARYEAAVQSRILQQQLLDAEEKKFNLGASTSYNVVQQQRDLAAAQASELSALATWQSAKISLDQATGDTLEANHISLAEAKAGKVSQASALPETLPVRP